MHTVRNGIERLQTLKVKAAVIKFPYTMYVKGGVFMRKPKIYLESTIFNHYFDIDREAHAATVKLFKEIQVGNYCKPYGGGRR